MIDLSQVLPDDPRAVHRDESTMVICARWQDVTIPDVDALLADPPYSEQTHSATDEHVAGSDLPDGASRAGFHYEAWTRHDAEDFVRHMQHFVRGWMAVMSDDILIPTYRSAFHRAGRYDFAPVPIIQPRPRLVGDGPASWAVYLNVCRPRTREFSTWGCLPGAYRSRTVTVPGVLGAKPIELMREIVAGYTRQGDVILDPCCGSGSTLAAAKELGRQAIGIDAREAACEAAAAAVAKATRKLPLRRESIAWQPDALTGKQEGWDL